MKRYIKSNSYESDDYVARVLNLLAQSGFDELIEDFKVHPDSGPDAGDPMIAFYLKEPYKCRYYYRVQSYLDWFNVIPSRDWISSGSPDTNIYLKPTDPDNVLLRKLKDFRQKIAKLTSEYQSQDHEV